MSLDRSIAPAFGKIETIDLMEPKLFHLDNGLPVFVIDSGDQEVLKVELVFPTGTAASEKKLVAAATAELLTEGTSQHTAEEIANALDFYGAYFNSHVSHDESSLELYTLNKHLKNTIATMAEVYSQPTFPEHELETFILKGQQDMLVNEQKVSYLAAKAFNATLFGKEHPYGRSAEQADYEALSRNDLTAFHQSRMLAQVAHIIVAGKLTDETISVLNEAFGQEKRVPNERASVDVNSPLERKVHVEKSDAVQNAIRIGRILFDRTHRDFVGMQILCTVLGGYFGSRLMANIREDKGYTYGIGAGLVSLKHTGYLSISTEVGSQVCKPALDEIHLEIGKLRKELIPTDELELVRNYMLGTILKSVDGPFSLASKWKTYLKHGMGTNDHYQLLHQIRTITPERLRDLANQYLQQEDLIQVTSGKPF
jgi:predicted Zn-dependent peptidase